MTTLLLGFLGLVILPAMILAAVLKRLVREPADLAVAKEDYGKFTG